MKKTLFAHHYFLFIQTFMYIVTSSWFCPSPAVTKSLVLFSRLA